MDVMDAKVTGIADKVEESVEYSRDIKNGLKDRYITHRAANRPHRGHGARV